MRPEIYIAAGEGTAARQNWLSGERQILRMALAGSVVVHLAVISLFALTPSWTANGLDIEGISVFESAAASFAQPVEMVRLEELQETPEPEMTTVILTAPISRPDLTKALTQEPKISRPLQRRVISPQPRPPETAAPGRVGPPVPEVRPTPAVPGGHGGEPSASVPGGGGGGPKLPLALPWAGEPEVPLGPGGNTPLGQLPGSGTGSGSGGGSGTGTGSGSGSGSGQGSGSSYGGGSGTGIGPGSGPGVASGDGGGGGGFSSTLADRSEPKVVRKGAFSYPSSAAEEGVEGTVVLEVLVDEKGEVAKVKIASSSGDGRLDGAAQDWIKGWRYLPAVQDGRPRRVWTKAKVVFRLE